MGLLADQGKNLDEALRLAQQATKKAPDQNAVTDTMGWVYLKKGMPDEALTIFQSLVQKEPKNAGFLRHLGLAQIEKGLKSSAKATLEKALRCNPHPDEIARIREAIARIS